jgi:hypothetical protein
MTKVSIAELIRQSRQEKRRINSSFDPENVWDAKNFLVILGGVMRDVEGN